METNPLTISLDDFTWDNYREISEALTSFNDQDISMELTRQASIYSYYHGLMSVAKLKMTTAINTLTSFSAQLRKNSKAESGSKKLTAKDLDDIVDSNPTCVGYQRELTKATFKYELIKGLVKSLDHKKDMLVQASSNQRAETKLYS